ncbi:MAG: hypothetical protein L7S67_08120 [Flavobacteriales bacterium]|nr:hypothetical protein [Flavobacteriales bacterium]
MEAERHLRLGVVDCGTNTFALHIADVVDGTWKTTFRQRRFVRLGLDSFRSGRLSPQRMRRGLDVLDAFGDTVRNYNVDQVRAFGCSALRDAANGAQFVADAAQKGWHIEVVDGGTEAEWIHLGVRDTMRHAEQGPASVLTVDIGGGSVELIHWAGERTLGRWSLDLGVARLTDWIKPNDPLSQQDMSSMRRIIDGAIAPVLEAVSAAPPQYMVGTSGAFNTLMALEDRSAHWQDPRVADPFEMDVLRARCVALASASKADLHKIEGMHPDRVPYMSVACVLIGHILERFDTISQVYRSRHTLAEGALVHAAGLASQTVSWEAIGGGGPVTLDGWRQLLG